jgi:type IV pilus assembly protein PilM
MYVTLNISPNSIRLLSVEGRRVRKWGSTPLPPGLVRDGLVLKPKVVGTVIGALFKSTGLPKKQVITSLTGLSFIHRILSLPRMKRAAQAEAIHRAARKEMLLPLEELYLSAQAIGERPDELDFFVLGVPRHLVDTLVQTLAEAGVPPYLVDLNPLALARAANRAEALIVDMEPDCFDIVLVADGMPAIMRTITPKGEGATTEDNIQRLVSELSKTVEFYNGNHPQNPLSPTTPLLLTGELATDTATELIRAGTGHPTEPLTPPLEIPPDLPAALFATNIGLALKKLPAKREATGYRDINLNVFSDRLRERTPPVKLPNIILSLVVVTGLGLLPYMYHLRSQAAAETVSQQTEVSRVNHELDQARLSAKEAKQTEATINKILADTQTVKQEHQHVLSQGGDFARNLKLVTTAFPTEAYFTSVKIGPSQITVTGEADNSFTVVNYVTTLEALGEFPGVRIVRISEGQSAGVSFEVAINK